jgi:hypothetical protein
VRADEKLTGFLELESAFRRIPHFGCEIFALQRVRLPEASPKLNKSLPDHRG